MKVLLTGHKGYIGSVLAPLLAERDHEVDRPLARPVLRAGRRGGGEHQAQEQEPRHAARLIEDGLKSKV